MYTHGLTVIISTKKRYGGFAKAVGMSAMTTPTDSATSPR